MKLTKNQVIALRLLCDNWYSFPYGQGKYNVSLRALLMRPDRLVERKTHKGAFGEIEDWRITDAGRAALAKIKER